MTKKNVESPYKEIPNTWKVVYIYKDIPRSAWESHGDTPVGVASPTCVYTAHDPRDERGRKERDRVEK